MKTTIVVRIELIADQPMPDLISLDCFGRVNSVTHQNAILKLSNSSSVVIPRLSFKEKSHE